MTFVLPLSPLHIPSLALSRLPPSEARPWEALTSQGPEPLALALAHLWPWGRRAWVATHGPLVRALATAVSRTSKTWEISGLCADPQAAMPLLRWAARQLALLGAERLLLRLPAEGPLVVAAHRAGFLVLACEHLYRLAGGEGTAPPPLSPLGPEDQHAAFHLYLTTSPASVRALQGPTLSHWQAAMAARGPTRDLGLWHEGQLVAWARLRFTAGEPVATVILHPRARERAQEVVAAVAAAARRPLHFLVPAHQQALASALEALGAQPRGQLLSLVMPLARAVALPQEAMPEPFAGKVVVS